METLRQLLHTLIDLACLWTVAGDLFEIHDALWYMVQSSAILFHESLSQRPQQKYAKFSLETLKWNHLDHM
jgi:hypothetical protein